MGVIVLAEYDEEFRISYVDHFDSFHAVYEWRVPLTKVEKIKIIHRVVLFILVCILVLFVQIPVFKPLTCFFEKANLAFCVRPISEHFQFCEWVEVEKCFKFVPNS